MKNKVLLIIDMQETFSASQNIETIEACKKEILQAIEQQEYIFFVEWENEGSTDKRLTSLARGYKKSYYIYKRQDSGAKEIMSKVYSIGIINAKFRVCGVNTDACVKRTVADLADYGRHGRLVEVVGRACNTDWGNNYSALQALSKITNVTVV